MTFAPICRDCSRLRVGAVPWSCGAFPGGIPEPIQMNRADHRRPYPGDGGLRFELRPGATEPPSPLVPPDPQAQS